MHLCDDHVYLFSSDQWMLKSEILISHFPCDDRTLVGIEKMEGIRTPMKLYLYLFNGCLRVFFEKAIFSIFCWETKNGEQSIPMDLKHFVSLFCLVQDGILLLLPSSANHTGLYLNFNCSNLNQRPLGTSPRAL